MKYAEPTPEDYENIAQKVRSGEYFREARAMYNVLVNDTMTERYFYVFVTGIALLTFMVAFWAMQSLYPLSRTVPFVYSINDVLEDLPTIAPLRTSPNEKVDDAVLFFLAKNYVKQYESYNIDTVDRSLSAVQYYSAPEVLANYQLLYAQSNPNSPINLYQRHSVRTINVLSVQKLESPANTLDIIYEASAENTEQAIKTRYRATLTYEYGGVEFDAKTDTVKPLTFLVKNYNSKLIQE